MKSDAPLAAAIPPSHHCFGNRSRGGRAMANCRKPAQWIAAAAAVGWFSMLAVQPAAAREGTSRDGIAAHVNGEAITTEQLEEAIQTEKVRT